MPSPTILIAGAGIGGLTAALSLAALGRDITLVERATGFSEIGAGLQLSPNASRILIDLGLGPALRRIATEPERVMVRAMRSGALLGEVALGAFMRERFGAPYWVAHRADLQMVLLDAVRSRPNIRLLVGRSVIAVEDGPEAASALVETAGGARETLRADLVVGADGIRSRVRQALGGAREPVFSGSAAWRATVARDSVPSSLAGNETGLWLGRGLHVVHYPIAGGRLVNIVAVRGQAAPVEEWGAVGDPAELRATFAEAAPPLRALLDLPEDWLVWSLFDLRPTRTARGRIALLGDAAHPVLPFLAQGAALAIEDAAALAGTLSEADRSTPAALARYARMRWARVRKVQAQARRNGRLYHAGSILGFARDAVMRRLDGRAMAERYAWLYGWTPPSRS